MKLFNPASVKLLILAVALSGCASPDTTAAGERNAPAEGAPERGTGLDAAGGAAGRAPLRLTVPSRLAPAAESMPLYRVIRDAPLVTMDALQRVFRVRGQPEHSEDLGGVSHLRDGERHAYVYDHGGAAYHDVDHLGSESPMRPLGEAWLRQDAGERLASLGLPGGGPVKLVPAKLGAQQASRMDASGKPVETWLTGQSVSFVQTIDNLPVFGAGAQVQIDYVDGGVVAGFSHGLRRLESAGAVAVDSPEAAIQRYAARAESQNRWNLYRSYIYKVDRLEIEEAELGYYLPDAGTPVETVEPVYALRGLAHGYDHRGRPAVVQVLWLEPASVGREIPSLFISAEASR